MLNTVQGKFGPSLPLSSVPNTIEREYIETYQEAKTLDSSNRSEECIVPPDCPNPSLQNEAVESPVDMYVNAEMILPSSRNDGTSELCRVTNLAQNDQGEGLGSFNKNPLLNTQVYDIEDPDGKV